MAKNVRGYFFWPHTVQQQTRQHWIQRITFAAEINAALWHVVAAGHCTHTDTRMPTAKIPFPLAKQCGKGNKTKITFEKHWNTKCYTTAEDLFLPITPDTQDYKKVRHGGFLYPTPVTANKHTSAIKSIQEFNTIYYFWDLVQTA